MTLPAETLSPHRSRGLVRAVPPGACALAVLVAAATHTWPAIAAALVVLALTLAARLAEAHHVLQELDRRLALAGEGPERPTDAILSAVSATGFSMH